MNCYTVYKRTGTHADVLAAIGAADLLRDLSPRIREFEDRFEIALRRDLLPSDLELADPGFLGFVKTQGERKPPIDRMYSILGRMKAYGGPNKVMARFARTERGKWTRGVWESLHGRPGFVLSTALVQLFNPHAGKGYALPKPNGTNRDDRTKDRWADPFQEWLRYRGFFGGSAGWFASGDFRLYCPIPADISYVDYALAAAGVRELNLGGTAVKMDCRAVLGLTRVLIENALICRRPREAIGGVWVTHYKDMGQAHTFMAMDRLALPDWFDLRNSQQAEMWLRTLDEHDTLLRRLTDSHSDEFALLKQYRRTFQINREESNAELLTFLMDYGILLFKRRAQDYWMLPQLPVSGIAGILGRDPALRKAANDPGLLAVAAAIRGSTVGAQAYRRNGSNDHREIRYGLLSKIRGAGRNGKPELLRAVSGFVASFNRESANRRAAGRAAMQIQDGELEAFRSLLAESISAVTACALLCGLATAIPGASAISEVEQALPQALSA